jgi:hypothetical protein
MFLRSVLNLSRHITEGIKIGCLASNGPFVPIAYKPVSSPDAIRRSMLHSDVPDICPPARDGTGIGNRQLSGQADYGVVGFVISSELALGRIRVEFSLPLSVGEVT